MCFVFQYLLSLYVNCLNGNTLYFKNLPEIGDLIHLFSAKKFGAGRCLIIGSGQGDVMKISECLVWCSI